jgi:hypothetical protein
MSELNAAEDKIAAQAAEIKRHENTAYVLKPDRRSGVERRVRSSKCIHHSRSPSHRRKADGDAPYA